MKSLSERFWSKVDKAGPVPEHRPDLGPCWLWTGMRDADGYGNIKIDNTRRHAHRIGWSILVGDIPEGLQPDHLCRVRHCVNPVHIEIVTPRINTLRGNSPIAQQAKQTRCIHGHELSDGNTYRYGNQRVCKTCIMERQRRYRAQRKSG